MTAPNIIIGGTPDFSKRDKRDLDVVVGKQSEERWDTIKKDQAKRNEVRTKTGRQALGRKSDGSYAPLSDKRLANRTKAFEKFEHAKKTGIKVERDD